MKRIEYSKPTMKVVKLRRNRHILTVSDTKSASGESFTWDDDE